MSAITQSTIPYLFDSAVTEVAFEEFYAIPMLWSQLYNVKTSTKAEEVHASFRLPGLYQAKVEGASMSEDTIEQQFKKTFSHTPYALMLEVSREARDDDPFGLIEQLGTILGQKAAETMEHYGALLFDNLNNSTYYTSEDSLSIANDAHVNAASANSQDNLNTLSLNYANAKTTRLNMRKFKGYDADQKMSIIPDEIITGLDLEEEAWQLVRTAGKPDTADNNRNFFSSGYTYYLWPWLTWTTQWAMMASSLRKQFLKWYQRVGLEIAGDATFSQMTRKLGGYMRFANGCTDWRWIYFNVPS